MTGNIHLTCEMCLIYLWSQRVAIDELLRCHMHRQLEEAKDKVGEIFHTVKKRHTLKGITCSYSVKYNHNSIAITVI